MPTRRFRPIVERMVKNADERLEIRDGEVDADVLALCQRVGYGAVMDAAARLWQRRDPVGAFVVGPCLGTLRSALGQPIRPDE